MNALSLAGQGLTWLVFAALIGALAQGPEFSPHDAGHALLRVSMAHLSERLEPCRQLSEAERAELPPTRRVSEVCQRGRAPTRLVLLVDGTTLIDRTITPAGLSDDGRSYLMSGFPVEPGRRIIDIRLHDSPRPGEPGQQRRFEVVLEPGRVTLIEIGDEGIALEPLKASRRQHETT